MSSLARGRYDSVAMVLHWVIAALMIPMLFFGEDLMEVEDGGGGTFLPSLHVTIGVAILVLSVLRLAWRFVNPPPAYPGGMNALEQTASKLVHVGFYALMIGLPLTGWLAFPEFAREELGGGSVSILGLFALPGAPDTGLPFDALHNIGSKLGIGLLILHVVAALKHHFVNRDDILTRMLPGH